MWLTVNESFITVVSDCNPVEDETNPLPDFFARLNLRTFSTIFLLLLLRLMSEPS